MAPPRDRHGHFCARSSGTLAALLAPRVRSAPTSHDGTVLNPLRSGPIELDLSGACPYAEWPGRPRRSERRIRRDRRVSRYDEVPRDDFRVLVRAEADDFVVGRLHADAANV